uniref:Uncharacterized protein n=1 Tax=Rhizophora mucronata TaxID=61149 RepID=A0A2P2NY03_RHIMU
MVAALLLVSMTFHILPYLELLSSQNIGFFTTCKCLDPYNLHNPIIQH